MIDGSSGRGGVVFVWARDVDVNGFGAVELALRDAVAISHTVKTCATDDGNVVCRLVVQIGTRSAATVSSALSETVGSKVWLRAAVVQRVARTSRQDQC